MQPAFVPGAALPLRRPSPALRARARTPFACAASPSPKDAAADALAAEAGDGPAVAYGGLAPGMRRVVALAAAAAAATAGMVGMPARAGEIAKPLAAGVAGVSVGVAVSGLERGKEKAARKALAAVVRKEGSMDGPSVSKFVGEIGDRFGLDKAEVQGVVGSMYEMFLLEALRSPEVKYSEMSDLARLKKALAMRGDAVGDAHYEVGRAFYRNNVVYLDAEDDDEARKLAQAKMDKLFFLSDRMFADKETDEAAAYEVSRMCRFFAIPTSDFDSRVERVALPFYKDVIARACNDTAVDALDVSTAQAALGVSDTAATTVRLDAYADVVADLVENKGKLEQQDSDKLKRLRGLLNIPDDRATVTLKTLAEPVYRAEINKALDAASEKKESFAGIYGRLALRQSELGMPADAAKAALVSQASSRAIEIASRASKYLRVQNIASCISVVKELLDYGEDVVQLLSVASDSPANASTLLNEYIAGIPESLSKTEPRSMYRLYLSDILSDRTVSEKEEEQLKRLRAMVKLSEDDASDAFKAAAGPVYRKAVVDAFTNNKFDEETKAAKDKIKADLALPEETSKSIDLDLYKDRLEKLVQGNRIIQEKEAQELFVVRNFCGLSDDDVAGAHKYSMGPVYEQSVSEAMGATGIMLDEYREGLEKLRSRLLISKKDADDAFYRVVKRRMRMYVDRAMEQLEKRQNLRGSSEERDVGDDPNIKRAGAVLGIDAGGLPIELSNLVDFYVRNKLVVEEEVPLEAEEAVAAALQAATEAAKDGDEEAGMEAAKAAKTQTKKVTKYPVSMRGEIQPKVYNELYKQYVIQCFSAQTRGEKQRLFASLDQLGPILGMTEEEITAVHSQIGTVIYKNYVDQTLLKGPVADSDMEFLNNIQKMLQMKEDTCEKLLVEGKQNRVSILLERIFSSAKVLPESVKKMRAVASELGVDIVKDLKITAEQRRRLFGVEVDDAIDTGRVTGDSQDLIKEVQNALQLPDDAAKEVLLACIQRRTLSHLVQASASLRQNRSETVVAELRTMLRYGKLLPAKVEAPAVSSVEKQEMFLLFQADLITDGAMDDKASQSLGLLQTLLGFSDADLQAVV